MALHSRVLRIGRMHVNVVDVSDVQRLGGQEIAACLYGSLSESTAGPGLRCFPAREIKGWLRCAKAAAALHAERRSAEACSCEQRGMHAFAAGSAICRRHSCEPSPGAAPSLLAMPCNAGPHVEVVEQTAAQSLLDIDRCLVEAQVEGPLGKRLCQRRGCSPL